MSGSLGSLPPGLLQMLMRGAPTGALNAGPLAGAGAMNAGPVAGIMQHGGGGGMMATPAPAMVAGGGQQQQNGLGSAITQAGGLNSMLTALRAGQTGVTPAAATSGMQGLVWNPDNAIGTETLGGATANQGGIISNLLASYGLGGAAPAAAGAAGAGTAGAAAPALAAGAVPAAAGLGAAGAGAGAAGAGAAGAGAAGAGAAGGSGILDGIMAALAAL